MVLPGDETLLPEVSCNPRGPLTFHKQKVMVKITAPHMEGKTADLDIVAVMDISGSMQGTKLELMKEAMSHLIDTLKPDDRLAVIAFHSIVDDVSKKLTLTKMIKSKKEVFKGEVNALRFGGGTNIKVALEKGISILKDREDKQYEGSRRATCIFLMSDGEQNVGGDARTIFQIPDFTVHTFGLGTRHDELVLAEIAYRSNSGVYSNVPDDMLNNLQVFMQSKLALYRSITALDVKVTLTPTIPAPEEPPKDQVEAKAQLVGSISVDAGDYMVTDGEYKVAGGSKRGSRVISFGDLARDEIRRIIVDIPLHGITAPIVKVEQVLKVDCSYRLPHEIDALPVTVSVELARDKKADQYEMKPDVKRELVRRQQAEYLRMVKVWTDKGVDYLHLARGEVEKAREALDEHFKGPDDKISGELYEELGNLDYLLVPNANADDYKKLCRAYLLACLSSHGRQRFTGRGGKGENNPFYITERIKSYIKDAKKKINKTP